MTTADPTVSNWNCQQILGTGGFGIVKLWVCKQTGQKLAIKECKWDDTQLTPIQKERWAREVDIMKRLTHPNIVTATQVPFKLRDAHENMPALCMEYCTMGDLRRLLNKPENCCGITEVDALKIMSDILSAVKYLHSHNITHRDLKPENVVLQPINNIVLYKLIDLGYAKEIGEASTSASIVGTLNYVAPELLWDKKYSCSVDYWSLGILFYEVLTGKRPFLPQMQHTMAWMQIIKNKSYDDICAYECEGKVLFRQDIEDPIDLSSYVRPAVVEWFKIVLQWNPKERGRKLDGSGTLQPVIFTLLEPALSHKILYVFSASKYKINTYMVNDNTTVMDVQVLLEKDIHIPINQQILTDYYGNVLLNDTPLLTQIDNSVLFILTMGNMLVQDIPPLNMPLLVQKMIEQSKNEVSFEMLQDYYRATIFMMKHELNLFKLYIFALSIKVDLINARLEKFGKCMEDTLKNIDSLVTEVNFSQNYYTSQTTSQDKIKALEKNSKKVKQLLSAATQIQLKFTSLNEDNNVLRNIARNISDKDLCEKCSEALKVFETFKKISNRNGSPVKMVKVLFQFIKLQQTQFRENNIVELTSKIVSLENELLKLEGSFDSVIVMIKKYQQDLHAIIKEEPNVECPAQIRDISDIDKSMESHDNLILENLVVRHTVDNFMTEIHKMYQEVLSLDP